MKAGFLTIAKQAANHHLQLCRVAPADVRLSLLLVDGYPRPSYLLDLYCRVQSGRGLM